MKRRLPKHIPFDPHFKPRYNPWDQRVCVSPDGDFFAALHTGKADVQTDTIREVVADGIELNSGKKIPADIIITATGLKMEIGGQAKFDIDGKPIHLPEKTVWHGLMVQDLPNSFFSIGYVNASWTLGADANLKAAVRLLQTMREEGSTSATPRIAPGKTLEPAPLLNLSATYFLRASKDIPKAATTGPWQPRDNYVSDLLFAKNGNIKEDIEFTKGDGGLQVHTKSA